MILAHTSARQQVGAAILKLLRFRRIYSRHRFHKQAVLLSWNASTDNVGVTGYKVYQDGGVVATVSGTTVNIGSLVAETTYEFRVSAIDAAGNESAQSGALQVVTLAVPDTEAPSIPQNLRATVVSQTGCTLLWDASTDNVGVNEYKIYQDGNPIGTVSGTTIDVSSLTAGTSYQFRVSALDVAGNESSLSTALTVQTLGATITRMISLTIVLVMFGK